MEIVVRLTRPVALDVRLRVDGLTVLLGASGAGKTTLLKAITGLVPAEEAPWPGVPVERRPIGYMPQHYALFPHLSALENVAFPLAQLPRDERRRRALALLARVGAAHVAARRPRALSGGEQQRIALARALAREPALLLLDEPTSNLDVPSRAEVVEGLLALVDEVGVPMLVVTHDLELAAGADRLAVLVDGTIRQQGAPAELFAHPVDVAVARLVGVRNLHAGTVAARDGDVLCLESALGPVRAPAPAGAPLAVGDAVVWGVRPERVRLRAATDAPEHTATAPTTTNRIAVRVPPSRGGRAVRRAIALHAGADVELLLRAAHVPESDDALVAEFAIQDVVVLRVSARQERTAE